MVGKAIGKLKSGKVADVSGLTAEMVKQSGDTGASSITDLISSIAYECPVPDDWL